MSDKSTYASIAEQTSHQKKKMEFYTSDWDEALEDSLLSQWVEDWDD